MDSRAPGRALRGAVFLCLSAAVAQPQAHPEIDWQIAEFTRRIEARPTDTSLYVHRGELHRIHRDWPAAKADFLQARALDPQLETIDFHLGRLELEAGDLAAAVAALDRFLAKHPDHEPALAARAEARSRGGRYLEAARDWTRAIAATDGPQPTHYIERARALVAAGNDHVAEALRGLDEGLTRLGRPVTLELEAIELELRRGAYDSALARVDRIAAAAARQESWLVRRAEILELAGRPDEARAAYARALVAIEALPASRRGNRAMLKLRGQAADAVERLQARGR